MPEFVKPFSGTVPRKITKDELIRAIRLNISAEYEAVHLYVAHADATEDVFARQVLTDIANEERVHTGELQRLLEILLGDEAGLRSQGADEVNATAAKMGGQAEPPTIGSLK